MSQHVTVIVVKHNILTVWTEQNRLNVS